MRSLVICAYAAVWNLMVCLLNRRVFLLWTPIVYKISFWRSGTKCIEWPCYICFFTLTISSFWVDTVLERSDSGPNPWCEICLLLLIRCCRWPYCVTVLWCVFVCKCKHTSNLSHRILVLINNSKYLGKNLTPSKCSMNQFLNHVLLESLVLFIFLPSWFQTKTNMLHVIYHFP